MEYSYNSSVKIEGHRNSFGSPAYCAYFVQFTNIRYYLCSKLWTIWNLYMYCLTIKTSDTGHISPENWPTSFAMLGKLGKPGKFPQFAVTDQDFP